MSTLMGKLKTAIFLGDVKKVKKLLKSSAPIPLSKNPLIFGGYSLLKLAIKLRNRGEIVKLLIKKGARVNTKYCDKSVPLLNIAIRRQHFDIVKLLVKKGANVNELDRKGLTPMLVTIASLKNFCVSLIIVKILINHGADIHHRTESLKRTPLMLAIEGISAEIVDLLVKKGARIDDCDEDGVLPLYYIICNPSNVNSRLNVDMIERYVYSKGCMLMSLINAGANIKETTESAGTKLKFLRMAITYGQELIVRYLVESAEFDMLIDDEILQTVKLNTTLLSQEQLEDQEFMAKLQSVFMRMEYFLIAGLIRRHRSVKRLDEKWRTTIFSKPVNDFWNLSEYKSLVKHLNYDTYKRIFEMTEHKIGNSTISFFHLWTASWDQLVNFAYNKDVRELCFADYGKKYYMFTSMIEKRVNAAVKRSKLLEKSSEIIYILLKTLQ